MRVGTIVKDTEQFGVDEPERLLVYTGMVKGLCNLVYPRDGGAWNIACEPILLGSRYVAVGYCNLEESISSAIARIAANGKEEASNG